LTDVALAPVGAGRDATVGVETAARIAHLAGVDVAVATNASIGTDAGLGIVAAEEGLRLAGGRAAVTRNALERRVVAVAIVALLDTDDLAVAADRFARSAGATVAVFDFALGATTDADNRNLAGFVVCAHAVPADARDAQSAGLTKPLRRVLELAGRGAAVVIFMLEHSVVTIAVVTSFAAFTAPVSTDGRERTSHTGAHTDVAEFDRLAVGRAAVATLRIVDAVVVVTSFAAFENAVTAGGDALALVSGDQAQVVGIDLRAIFGTAVAILLAAVVAQLTDFELAVGAHGSFTAAIVPAARRAAASVVDSKSIRCISAVAAGTTGGSVTVPDDQFRYFATAGDQRGERQERTK